MLEAEWRIVEHQREIDKLDMEKVTMKNLDEHTTWLIIWKIREKIFDISEIFKTIEDIKKIEINNTKEQTKINIIQILELPIHIEKEFITSKDLIYYILWLDFNDIEERFIYHPFNRKIFLDWAKEFLKNN